MIEHLVKCILEGFVVVCGHGELVFWGACVCPSRTRLVCHRPPLDADAAEDRRCGLVCVEGGAVRRLAGRGCSREGGLWGALVARDWLVPACHSDFLAECVSSYKVPSKYLQIFNLGHPAVTFAGCRAFVLGPGRFPLIPAAVKLDTHVRSSEAK